MIPHAPLAAILTMLAISPGVAAEPGSGPAADRAHQVVLHALSTATEISDQARKLVALAWPPGKRDELVAADARAALIDFGDRSLNALDEAINTVKVDYTDEVVATAVGAQRHARADMVVTYQPILLDALWVGSHDAKARALREMAGGGHPATVQPMIDCAIADPSLAPQVVETLGALHYPTARYYLEKVMMEGSPKLRPLAASSLAQIGGAALIPLKNALKAPERDTRLLAARALLPVAREYDVGAIYEYLEKHGDDDPALTQSLKTLAQNIEKAIAARDAKAAASGPRDF